MGYLTGIEKGSDITVEPIRKIKDIKAVSKILESNPRNYLLWIMGINNGLRASDLVRLQFNQVAGLKVGDAVKIIETKTGKENFLVINKSVYKALQHYINEVNPDAEDYLFPSRKGSSHISSHTVGKLIRSWAASINLEGQYGSHTLRKTWGYHQRANHGASFELICKRYNHSSPAITMRYLGIEDKEVCKMLMNEIG